MQQERRRWISAGPGEAGYNSVLPSSALANQPRLPFSPVTGLFIFDEHKRCHLLGNSRRRQESDFTFVKSETRLKGLSPSLGRRGNGQFLAGRR
jgi:hypothetical protein